MLTRFVVALARTGAQTGRSAVARKALVALLVTTLLGTLVGVGNATAGLTQRADVAPFSPRVDALASAIVTGSVTSTEVVTDEFGAMWTIATMESADVERGAELNGANEWRIATPGGTDPISGEWSIASHAAELATGDVARVALMPAPDDTALGSDLWLVAMGVRGCLLYTSPSPRD